MLNERFTSYFHNTFFQGKDGEFGEFLHAIEQPIKRSLRIKKNHIIPVKTRLERDGWILGDTNIENVFLLDRRDDFDPLERRIGFSLDHLVGNFYIQELAAAHPVDILADGRIHDEPFLILDMASSPGGKTTQLAEYFPRSFIIANEPGRERIPQLLQNLERMGTPNVAITLYNGQYWKNFGETFDRILLDAPCSGEGTLYKGTEATKYWHIKNIKQIAHLQERLLDAAVHALKTGGEMIYSTCALNLLENESVVENILSKYPGHFVVTFQKKFWPHIDQTGGFFVTKIQKVKPLEEKEEVEKPLKTSARRENNSDLKRYRDGLNGWETLGDITLYEHGDKVLAVRNADIGETLREEIFPMRWGEIIGYREHGKFIPNSWAHRYIKTDHLEHYTIEDDNTLDHYLRGGVLPSSGKDGYILVLYNNTPMSIDERQDNIIKNRFPKDWLRK